MYTLIKIIEIFYAVIFGAVAIILAKVISKIEIKKETKKRYIAFIFIWYATALILSLKGFFHNPAQFSKGDNIGLLFILILMAIPIILFFIFLKQNSLQTIIKSLDINFLMKMQIYRILPGIYWFALMMNNIAPLPFVLSAGIFDSLIGLVAFNSDMTNKYKKIWSFMGILDFLLAFGIYFLYFPFKILKVSPSMIMWGGFYPVAFIVLFVVPLSVILHITVLIKLKRA